MIRYKDLSDLRFHWLHWDCVSICAMLSAVPRSSVCCHMPQVPYAHGKCQLFWQKICLLQDHGKLCQKIQRSKWAVCLCPSLNQLWPRTQWLWMWQEIDTFCFLHYIDSTQKCHILSFLLCASILLSLFSFHFSYFFLLSFNLGRVYNVWARVAHIFKMWLE